MTTQERIMTIIKDNGGKLDESVYQDDVKSVNAVSILGEQWSDGTMKDSVKIGCYNIQKALWTASPSLGLEDVVVFVKGEVVDAYGKQSVAQVGFCTLKSGTAAKFNWDNLTWKSAWDVYDDTGLAPFLQNA